MPTGTLALLLLLAERAAPLRLDALVARAPTAPIATAPRPNAARCGRRPVTMLDDGWDSRYLSELQDRISSTTAAAEEAALIGPAEEVLRHLDSAWVLIFNAGEWLDREMQRQKSDGDQKSDQDAGLLGVRPDQHHPA